MFVYLFSKYLKSHKYEYKIWKKICIINILILNKYIHLKFKIVLLKKILLLYKYKI